jgi:hypothetical protein
MTTRRLAYWWLRFVFSGRFMARFLTMGRANATSDEGAARHEDGSESGQA